MIGSPVPLHSSTHPMIVVRNIFQIKAGAMKQAVALIKQGLALTERAGFSHSRALTDIVGDFYTLVLETECASLQDFERGIKESFSAADWQAWYQQLTPLVQSGRREIMQIVD
jgi:hypothetical protein